jgi:hypothetical protein
MLKLSQNWLRKGSLLPSIQIRFASTIQETSNIKKDATIVEVGPRDGLQNEKVYIR